MEIFDAGVKTPATFWMRLVPRFSLRFALLALTIFLIVFAVGVKYWKRAQGHQDYVHKLSTPDVWVAYEEEELTLAGIFLGKQLTGLCLRDHDLNQQQSDLTEISLFNELPNPRELRRLGCLFHDHNGTDPPDLDSIFAKLLQCTSLERLQLHDFVVKPMQLRQLGALRELRILDLSGCKIPVGELAFLDQLPHLEILCLNFTGASYDELVKLKLPRLRVLDLTGCALSELRLTRDGWGAFPNLETLILSDAKLQRLVTEPAALPNLRHLDLNLQGRACVIDWEQLAAAVPQLEGLALHVSQYGPSTDRALQKLPHLRAVHFCINSLDDDWANMPRMTWLYRRENEKVYFLESQEPLLKAWFARAPQTRFYESYIDFLTAISPVEINLGEREKPWPSEYWNARSQGGIF